MMQWNKQKSDILQEAKKNKKTKINIQVNYSK